MNPYNSERESNLLKNYDQKIEENLIEPDNNKSKRNKIIIIYLIIILILVILFIILFFTVFSKDEDNKDKKDEYDESSSSEIDTISKEELNKAREAFKQYKFIDTINNSYTLDYNLFIPLNYTKEKKYPLIMFITDASLVKKDVKSGLTETVGGPVWATERMQKKFECFVLVPRYNEVVIDDNRGYSTSEYINVTVRLINDLIDKYSIDKNKLYSTGQSMGAMTTLYLLANYPGLLAAGLVVDGQWRIDQLQGLINATFTYIAAGGDAKAFNGQNEVKVFFDELNISYGNLTDINAKENIDILNNETSYMYNLNYSKNFITYIKGSVLPSNSDKANEHMSSFKYGYRIDVVRDWLLSQNKIKCPENTYYSEDGKCSETNFCKKARKDSRCKECIFGYYLSSGGTCTKEKNCRLGDKKSGICNSCISGFYFDLQEKICKDNTIDEKYNLCEIVDEGICIQCKFTYYLSSDNKCTDTPNCTLTEKTLCQECAPGYYIGLDHHCTSVEKCINSYRGECNECEDSYYMDVKNNICVESKDNFINCKKNSYYSPEQCSICKKDYYLSQYDYLCYDNTSPGPFYKCEITDYKGEKCIVCVDEYYIGRDDANCTKIEGCLSSFDENTCLECDDYYCLDNKGNCTDNSYVINEDLKYYFRCKQLNEKGSKCEICEHDLNTTDDGICFDDEHCEIFEDEKCVKCQKDNPWGYYGFCLNDEFGCVDSFLEHCIRCGNIMDMDVCTQCEEGYEVDEFGECSEIEN